jgi:hypothetical protein
MPLHVDLNLIVGSRLENVKDLESGRPFLQIMKERCHSEDPATAEDPDFFREWLFDQRQLFIGTDLWLHEARDAGEPQESGEIFLGLVLGSAGSPEGTLYQETGPGKIETGSREFVTSMRELGLFADPEIFFIEYLEG